MFSRSYAKNKLGVSYKHSVIYVHAVSSVAVMNQ